MTIQQLASAIRTFDRCASEAEHAASFAWSPDARYFAARQAERLRERAEHLRSVPTTA